MKKIRLILIEDNRLLREGINAMLKKEPDINVLAALSDRDFALEKIEELEPDIVLLDFGLTSKNSLELVKSLKKAYGKVKIIIMDLLPVQEDIFQFVETGVSGFILKDASLQEFIRTIRSVSSGEKILPTILAGSLFSQIIDYGIKVLGPSKTTQSLRMTKREREIIKLIAEGLTNKEIAYKLHISIYTVKSHVHNILEKMALTTRVQIAINAHTIEPSSSD